MPRAQARITPKAGAPQIFAKPRVQPKKPGLQGNTGDWEEQLALQDEDWQEMPQASKMKTGKRSNIQGGDEDWKEPDPGQEEDWEEEPGQEEDLEENPDEEPEPGGQDDDWEETPVNEPEPGQDEKWEEQQKPYVPLFKNEAYGWKRYPPNYDPKAVAMLPVRT